MKLYYSPGACSLSPHIVLREAGYTFDLEKVDLKTKLTESGVDYNTVSEKSAVPMLTLDNGEQLTEGVAIIQYLADQRNNAGLVPTPGTMERARLQEWLNYISTELHKAFGPLFRPELGEATQEFFKNKIKKGFDYVSKKLGNQEYLLGHRFSVADAYLFTILGWTKWVGMDLSAWPTLVNYQKRVAARPQVQEALKAEGMLN